jgi:hypothetical protein
MSNVFTHEGYIVGNDARTSKNYRRKVRLRQTKTLWIAEDGSRFNKKWLVNPGTNWPLYCLESEPTMIST